MVPGEESATEKIIAKQSIDSSFCVSQATVVTTGPDSRALWSLFFLGMQEQGLNSKQTVSRRMQATRPVMLGSWFFILFCFTEVKPVLYCFSKMWALHFGDSTEWV